MNALILLIATMALLMATAQGMHGAMAVAASQARRERQAAAQGTKTSVPADCQSIANFIKQAHIGAKDPYAKDALEKMTPILDRCILDSKKDTPAVAAPAASGVSTVVGSGIQRIKAMLGVGGGGTARAAQPTMTQAQKIMMHPKSGGMVFGGPINTNIDRHGAFPAIPVHPALRQKLDPIPEGAETAPEAPQAQHPAPPAPTAQEQHEVATKDVEKHDNPLFVAGYLHGMKPTGQ